MARDSVFYIDAKSMDTTGHTIGIVGVGRMGANIARRLKDVGYVITAVHDTRAGTAAEVAAELGAHTARSLTEVTERAGTIITVVTDDAAMRAIYTPDGLLSGAKGKLFINCA